MNNTESSNLPTRNEEQIRREEICNYNDEQTQSDVLGTDEIGEEWCEEEKLCCCCDFILHRFIFTKILFF